MVVLVSGALALLADPDCRIIFQDDFNAQRGWWGPYGCVSYEAGELCIRPDTPTGLLKPAVNLGTYSADFKVSLDIRVVSGSIPQYGVLFRAQTNTTDYYFFTIAGTTYRFGRAGSKPREFGSGFTGEVNPVGVANRLEVTASGEHFAFRVNGYLVALAQDDSPLGMGFVTLVAGGAAGTDVRFDNLVLTDIGSGGQCAAVSAALAARPLTGTAPLLARFSNQSQGPITEVRWDFGDGTTSGEIGPEHTYRSAGSYVVTLTARGMTGAESKKQVTIKVTAPEPKNEPPVASFTWAAVSPEGARLLVEPRTGDSIQFDASGSSDPDGTIVSYEWDWESDGTFETQVTTATTEHAFTSSGPHRVTLRVTDDKGATATVTKTIGISAPQAPQASFTFSPTQPSVLEAVQFTDTSTDADGTITAWSWEFGDGAMSTDHNPTHTYSKKATFAVKLTVTDNDGLTGTKSQALTVVNLPPEASFTFEPQSPLVGQSVRFDASTSTDRDGTITSFAWDFDGDGKTDASGATVAYSFTSAEGRTVTLIVTDSDGATAQRQETITVAAVPPGPPRFAKQWGLVIGVAEYEDPAIPDL